MMEPFWNLWSSVYIGLVVLYCSDYSNIYDICNITWYYHIIDVYCILISISYIIIIPSTIIYYTNIFIIFHSKLEARRLWHSLYHVTTLSCKISCTSNVHEDAAMPLRMARIVLPSNCKKHLVTPKITCRFFKAQRETICLRHPNLLQKHPASGI